MLLLLLLHPPLLEVGWRGYCDGTGSALGGGSRADPRGCPGAIVRGSGRNHIDVVGALPRGVHPRVDHAHGDQGLESVHPPPSSSSLPMVVVVRLLLPPRRGAVTCRRRRRIRSGRGREQRRQLVDSCVHPSLEGDAPCHLPIQLTHARQEALRRELPLQLLHGVQKHYVLDAGNGLLATMMVVMRRRMNIMVVVMVRYLAAAKGGVRMGLEQQLLLPGRRMHPPVRHCVVAGRRRPTLRVRCTPSTTHSS